MSEINQESDGPATANRTLGPGQLDLSKGPYVFGERSLSSVFGFLRKALPSRMEINLEESKKSSSIQIQEGLWRRASLRFELKDQQLALVRLSYRITIAGSVITFFGTCIGLSIIFTLIASAMKGEFTPFASFGGLAGALFSSSVDNIIANSVRRSSWSADIRKAIERAYVDLPSTTSPGVVRAA